MIRFGYYLYNHVKLIYELYNYSQNKDIKKETILLENISNRISLCGSVMIKFCQWIIPKLEIYYINENDLLNKDYQKPIWLKKFENFYENCQNHSLEFTLNHYKEIFNKELTEDYKIIDIIGSGSIGQVYLLEEKKRLEYLKSKKYILKILHPNVKYEINFFRIFYKLLKGIPQLNDKIKKYIPFDINHFIDLFEDQSNFIHEANHLLRFQNIYKKNQNIIIPELIQCSKSILIMTYEEGISYDDLKINKYQKYKIVSLFYLFLKNNLHIYNYNHGDLHKGNWKIRISEDNNHKLIIYDYGFCWSIQKDKTDIIQLITECFESADIDTSESTVHQISNILKYLLISKDKTINELKDKIYPIVKNKIENEELQVAYFSPISLFKFTIDLCGELNLVIDPILIQSIIISIQGQILFEEYSLQGNNNNIIKSYEIYRSRYLDFIAYCQTYKIFEEYVIYIKKELNKKQVKIENIFDCIQMSDSIKNLALKK